VPKFIKALLSKLKVVNDLNNSLKLFKFTNLGGIILINVQKKFSNSLNIVKIIVKLVKKTYIKSI